jgi:hypothetical protein
VASPHPRSKTPEQVRLICKRRAARRSPRGVRDAGREITQAFDTLTNNLTLAGGTLAALLAVIGAGELFGDQPVVVSVNGVMTEGALRWQVGLPQLMATRSNHS